MSSAASPAGRRSRSSAAGTPNGANKRDAKVTAVEQNDEDEDEVEDHPEDQQDSSGGDDGNDDAGDSEDEREMRALGKEETEHMGTSMRAHHVKGDEETERKLKAHNAAILRDKAARLETHDRFVCENLAVFMPFLSERTRKSWLARAQALGITPGGLDEQDVFSKHKPADTLSAQPGEIVRGTLRPYQLTGLNWLISRENNAVGGILGDEMGLGKTVQSISFLAYLKFVRKVDGPYLVIAPLSVLSSWMNEFARWCPSLRVVRFHGPATERRRLAREVCIHGQFDVVVTTYEVVKSEDYFFMDRFVWRYLIIDEAHRVKNEHAIVSQVLSKMQIYNCIMLTGTPAQNNMHELWALLNFLFPKIFTSSAPFDDCFDLTRGVVNDDMLGKAHLLLAPLMLRRIKKDAEHGLPPKTETKIYVPLSEYQTFWYKRLLTKDITILQHETATDDTNQPEQDPEKNSEWKRLMSLFMQLRKVCNHPYVFGDGDEGLLEEHIEEDKSFASMRPLIPEERARLARLVRDCGKMTILDKLLVKLHKEGHRVLVFSLFTSMLDILQEYCELKGWQYARLDGSTNRVQRNIDIRKFNAKDSPLFVYLISSRAGGLGINLASADTVIHYDSDFNPQVDLQAQDRCHRIGQTKPVHVYRLVTEGTVEERLIARAEKKLYLDMMVIGQSRLLKEGNLVEKLSKTEILSMLMFGADRIFRASNSVNDEDIDTVLSRSVAKTQKEKEDAARKLRQMVEQEGGALDVVDADAQDYESELEQEAARSASAPAASPIKPESSAAASATTLASPARANTANGHAEFSKVSPSKAKRKALEENVKMSVRNFVFSSEVQQIRQFQGKSYQHMSLKSIADEWRQRRAQAKQDHKDSDADGAERTTNGDADMPDAEASAKTKAEVDQTAEDQDDEDREQAEAEESPSAARSKRVRRPRTSWGGGLGDTDAVKEAVQRSKEEQDKKESKIETIEKKVVLTRKVYVEIRDNGKLVRAQWVRFRHTQVRDLWRLRKAPEKRLKPSDNVKAEAAGAPPVIPQSSKKAKLNDGSAADKSIKQEDQSVDDAIQEPGADADERPLVSSKEAVKSSPVRPARPANGLVKPSPSRSPSSRSGASASPSPAAASPIEDVVAMDTDEVEDDAAVKTPSRSKPGTSRKNASPSSVNTKSPSASTDDPSRRHSAGSVNHSAEDMATSDVEASVSTPRSSPKVKAATVKTASSVKDKAKPQKSSKKAPSPTIDSSPAASDEEADTPVKSKSKSAKAPAADASPSASKSKATEPVLDPATALAQALQLLDRANYVLPEPYIASIKRERSTARYEHEDWCHVCKIGGTLVCCNWCPRTYHPECVGLTEVPKGYFSCPQHSCAVCSRKANEAGGLLFRCLVCPCSYCEDHVPDEFHGRVDMARSRDLERLHYAQPASASYILCSHACVRYHKKVEENRNKGRLDVDDDDEGEDEKDVEEHTCLCLQEKKETKTNKVFCICRTQYDEDRFYVLCDECQEWFHGECVGVQEDEVDETEPWSCQWCKNKPEEGKRAEANEFKVKAGDDDASDDEVSESEEEEEESLPPTPDESDEEGDEDENLLRYYDDVKKKGPTGKRIKDDTWRRELEAQFPSKRKRLAADGDGDDDDDDSDGAAGGGGMSAMDLAQKKLQMLQQQQLQQQLAAAVVAAIPKGAVSKAAMVAGLPPGVLAMSCEKCKQWVVFPANITLVECGVCNTTQNTFTFPSLPVTADANPPEAQTGSSAASTAPVAPATSKRSKGSSASVGKPVSESTSTVATSNAPPGQEISISVAAAANVRAQASPASTAGTAAVSAWTNAQVADYLESVGLFALRGPILHHKITGAQFIDLSYDDIKEDLGIDDDAVIKTVLSHSRSLRNGAAAVTQAQPTGASVAAPAVKTTAKPHPNAVTGQSHQKATQSGKKRKPSESEDDDEDASQNDDGSEEEDDEDEDEEELVLKVLEQGLDGQRDLFDDDDDDDGDFDDSQPAMAIPHS